MKNQILRDALHEIATHKNRWLYQSSGDYFNGHKDGITYAYDRLAKIAQKALDEAAAVKGVTAWFPNADSVDVDLTVTYDPKPAKPEDVTYVWNDEAHTYVEKEAAERAEEDAASENDEERMPKQSEEEIKRILKDATVKTGSAYDFIIPPTKREQAEDEDKRGEVPPFREYLDRLFEVVEGIKEATCCNDCICIDDDDDDDEDNPFEIDRIDILGSDTKFRVGFDGVTSINKYVNFDTLWLVVFKHEKLVIQVAAEHAVIYYEGWKLS